MPSVLPADVRKERGVGRRRMTDEQAEAELEARGFEALVPYPGLKKLPWAVIHDTCGRTVVLTLGNLTRSRASGCRWCTSDALNDAGKRRERRQAVP